MLALAAFFFTVSATAGGAQWQLETSTSTGILVGTSRELVLDGSYLVSRLEWAMQPLVLAQTGVRVSLPTGLRVSLDVAAGVPAETGSITDEDFLNYDGDVTHYSAHRCFTEGSLLLDTKLGWGFILGERFTLEPFAAFSLMRFKWTARDGYLQYPPEPDAPYTPWDPQTTDRVPVYGTGIVYQQIWYLPSVGLGGSWDLGSGLSTELAVRFSPLLFMNDLDNHELRLLDFYGETSGGYLLEPSARLAWRFNGRSRLAFDVSYRSVHGLVGDTLVVGAGVAGDTGTELAPNEKLRFSDASGGSYDAFRVSLALELGL